MANDKGITTWKQQAKVKAAKYCAYQERTHQEVRDKLYSYGLYSDAVEEVLTELISEGFVDEERFARAFARGKFRSNKWGRIKIEMGLRQKGLSDYCIRSGLQEINESEYVETLQSLIQKKWNALAKEEPYARKHKTARFVVGKGYESELVWKLLSDYEE